MPSKRQQQGTTGLALFLYKLWLGEIRMPPTKLSHAFDWGMYGEYGRGSTGFSEQITIHKKVQETPSRTRKDQDDDCVSFEPLHDQPSHTVLPYFLSGLVWFGVRKKRSSGV